MPPFFRCVVVIGLIACVLPADVLAAEKIDFSRDIRPILASNCYQCHGPDGKQREADLRLDTKAGAFAEHDGRRAFVASKPAQSEAFRRMTSGDPDERMPPPDSGKKLTAEQIQLIRGWIEQGAPWAVHWAFVAPQRPAVPKVKHALWLTNPIDAFVAKRLGHEQLQPSPPAGKTTLLRRLSFDLIGLPPSIEEVDAFLADNSRDAYQQQVERLLKSPHYGERWGRHWLDAARYADSDGFEKDKPRFVWFYRDWVINALNRDMPYDQFIIEQIAGDLLPDSTQDQLVATGFLRNSMINEEGGVDPEQFRMEAMFDRMDAVGKAILGITIQCGQCHSHKYDPLKQDEYYRMFAFVNNSHEACVTVYTPKQQSKHDQIRKQIASIEARLKRDAPDWRKRMRLWEKLVRDETTDWTVLPIENAGSNSQRYYQQADLSLLAQGYAPTKSDAPFSVTTKLPSIRAFRLEVLTDPNLPAGGPGRSIQGLFGLTEFKVEVADARTPDKKTYVKFVRASADFSNTKRQLGPLYGDRAGKRGTTGPVDFAIDGKDETAWGIDAGPDRRNQNRKAVFVADKDIAFPNGTALTFHLVQKHGGWNSDDNQNMNLGRFRISASGNENPNADPLPSRVREILSRDLIADGKRTESENNAVFQFWRTIVTEWKPANDEIEALWTQHPEGVTQLVLSERDRSRSTHRLERGDFLKPLERVVPGVPKFLHALPSDAPPTRLTFARWLADRNSPTTARAIVNRVWQAYFNTGLVATSEDLGTQSEAPSHPELLDWLSVEFMDRGWSLKTLHRLIVNSSTYRQSSRVSPQLYARDPYNRLLARGPRFRVEAEVVRDIALAASGLLNSKVGGPSVYPPAPEFLFNPPASYGPKTWKVESGPDRYRRGVYTFRFRSVPYPVLQSFDAPNGDAACVRRVRSNTPLQALTTLNEPLFMECAQALALRTLTDGGATNNDRLDFAFRRCVARKPLANESQVLLGLLAKSRNRFDPAESKVESSIGERALKVTRSQSAIEKIWQLAAPDPKNPPTLPTGVTPAQLAAWTVVCRVLLNLDETITKE